MSSDDALGRLAVDGVICASSADSVLEQLIAVDGITTLKSGCASAADVLTNCRRHYST